MFRCFCTQLLTLTSSNIFSFILFSAFLTTADGLLCMYLELHSSDQDTVSHYNKLLWFSLSYYNILSLGLAFFFFLLTFAFCDIIMFYTICTWRHSYFFSSLAFIIPAPFDWHNHGSLVDLVDLSPGGEKHNPTLTDQAMYLSSQHKCNPTCTFSDVFCTLIVALQHLYVLSFSIHILHSTQTLTPMNPKSQSDFN